MFAKRKINELEAQYDAQRDRHDQLLYRVSILEQRLGDAIAFIVQAKKLLKYDAGYAPNSTGVYFEWRSPGDPSIDLGKGVKRSLQTVKAGEVVVESTGGKKQ